MVQADSVEIRQDHRYSRLSHKTQHSIILNKCELLQRDLTSSGVPNIQRSFFFGAFIWILSEYYKKSLKINICHPKFVTL